MDVRDLRTSFAAFAPVDGAEWELPCREFLDACELIKKLMGSLGRCMSFALSDIAAKLEQIDEYITSAGEACPSSLLKIVEKEVSLNVHDAGKKNPSITRTLLRLMWFLDFVAAFLSKLGENTSASVTFVAREAYNEKLAPNHPWIVRKAASASMALCPSRDSLMKSISLNGTTPSEEQCEILISTGNEMKKTLDKLWAYYTSNEITKLK